MRPFDDVDLLAFVDNQVGPNRREAIDTYLKHAPDDAERVAKWQRQNEAIRSAFAPVASEAVPLWLAVSQIESDRGKPTTAARASLAALPSPLRAGQGSPRLRTRAIPHVLIAAAIAFVAGLSVPIAANRWPGLGGYVLMAGQAASREGIAQRALEAHNTYGTDADRPVEVADVPEGTLKRWLERRVPFSVTLPDLSTEGWTLRGGRVVPADRGPGALLVYENGVGDRLSLFMSRAAPGVEDEAPEEPSPDGVLAWAQGSIGYAIVTSRSPAWLSRNQRQLTTAIRGSALAD